MLAKIGRVVQYFNLFLWTTLLLPSEEASNMQTYVRLCDRKQDYITSYILDLGYSASATLALAILRCDALYARRETRYRNAAKYDAICELCAELEAGPAMLARWLCKGDTRCCLYCGLRTGGRESTTWQLYMIDCATC